MEIFTTFADKIDFLTNKQILNFMKKVNEVEYGYQSPMLEVLNIVAEAGFTISDGIGLPGENPNFNDFGDF